MTELTVENVVNAAVKAMNSEAGQALTEKLITEVLKKNPNMTMKEWKETQVKFLAYMTITMVKETAII